MTSPTTNDIDAMTSPIVSSPPLGLRARARRLLSFPNPVNEVSARLVAGGVALLSLLTIVLAQPWLTALIAYGFLARVASAYALLIVAATLESVFGLCLGCKAFAALMRVGAIPPQVCERCNDIAAARSPARMSG
jgi:hypothetical protein